MAEPLLFLEEAGKDPFTVDLVDEVSSDADWENGAGEALRLQAGEGRLLNQATRALCWRLFLGVIPAGSPPSRWAAAVAERRARYDEFKKLHWPDITLASDDPLSANGAWQQFYEHQELVELIKADLARLYPAGCGEYFLTPRLQRLMLAVLVVWSRTRHATSYRQGMHEVLAPIVLVLEKEGMEMQRRGLRPDVADSSAGVPATAMSPPAVLRGVALEGREAAHLENDAFWLFAKVMEGLEPLYLHEAQRGGGAAAGAAAAKDPPLLALCNRAQGERLAAVDPDLEAHLRAEGVTPQLYGVRWARLLFVREFKLHDCLRVWDWLFSADNCNGSSGRFNSGIGNGANGNGLPLTAGVELVMAAMLMTLRKRLLAEDGSGCLQLLMNYTPPADVGPILALARNLWGPLPLPAPPRQRQPQAQPQSLLEPPLPLPASTGEISGEFSGDYSGAMAGTGALPGSPPQRRVPASAVSGGASSPWRTSGSMVGSPQPSWLGGGGAASGSLDAYSGEAFTRGAATPAAAAAGGGGLRPHANGAVASGQQQQQQQQRQRQRQAMPAPNPPYGREYPSALAAERAAGGAAGAAAAAARPSPGPLRHVAQAAEEVGRNLLSAAGWAAEGVGRAYQRYEGGLPAEGDGGATGAAAPAAAAAGGGGSMTQRRWASTGVAPQEAPPTAETIYTSELGRSLREALARVRIATAGLRSPEREAAYAALADAEMVAAVLLRQAPLPRSIAAAAAAVGGGQRSISGGGG